MKKSFLSFLIILLSGYILCTTGFATTDSLSFSCDLATGLSKNITVGATSDVTVNWGDGSAVEQIPVTLINNYGEAVLKHTYSEMNNYNVSIQAENIKKIEAKGNDILSINLTNIPSIRELYIDNNKITELDLSNKSELKYLSCSNNYLTQLEVSSTNILALDCSNNKLNSLSISNPNSLKLLYANANNLSELDLSYFSQLMFLDCSQNKINSLLISECSLLEKLNFANNFISEISLVNNTALRELYCNSNELELLNLSNNVNIDKVNCTYNKIKNLYLNNNSQLKELYVFENSEISSIDLENIKLELIVLDSTTEVTNNASECTIKTNVSGSGGIAVDNNKKLILSTMPYRVLLNGEDIAFETNILDLSEYSGENNISFCFYILEDYQDFNINEPQLLRGMIPVKYDGYSWVITNSADNEWYNYKDKRWANVMLRDGAKYLDVDGVTLVDIGENTPLEDLIGKAVPETSTGSMYVWIPRFSFKIGETGIDIEYSEGLVDYTEDGYILHPAFNYASYKGGETSNSSNYENLTSQNKYLGMWVAKYPAGNASVPKYASNVEEIRNLSIKEAFRKVLLAKVSSYGLSGGTSHMIKNTEWGAVAYLTSGIGNINSESTTGNKYGIYNLNSNPEYVSAFIELIGGISSLSVRENGTYLIPYAMPKYNWFGAVIKDIDVVRLRRAQDDELNSNVFSKYYGIAMNEVDTGISGIITKNIPNKRDAFLIRGIDGIYSYSGSTGEANSDVGFRNVIFGNGINNNDDAEYFTITATSNYGGKVSPYGSITVKEGEDIIYSIIPYTGYEISDVVVDGISEYYSDNCIDHDTYFTYQFSNISSNHEIHIEFDNIVSPYNVYVEKYIDGVGENAGIATVEGEGLHDSKSMVTVRVTPIEGYKLLNWEVPYDLENITANSSSELNFKMPNRDIVLKATFVEIVDAPLTVENMYSSITIRKDVGVQVDVVAGDIDGYKFREWVSEGLELTELQRTNASIQFIMPASGVRLIANYNKISPVDIVLGDGTLVKFEGEETKDIIFLAPETSSNKSFSAWKIDGYTYWDLGRGIKLTVPHKAVNIEAIYQ